MHLSEEKVLQIRKALETCWSQRTSICFNPDIAPLSYGQCAPTAIVVCEHFGGNIRKTEVKKRAGGSIRHFYNFIEGKRYDFTLDQFDIPDYWCGVKYDDTLSSIDDAMTETILDQVGVMRREFAIAIRRVKNITSKHIQLGQSTRYARGLVTIQSIKSEC